MRIPTKPPRFNAARPIEVEGNFIAAYANFAGQLVDPYPEWARERLAQLAKVRQLPRLEAPSLTQQLDAYTREHRNTALLIEHLRHMAREGSQVLDPILATLTADALEGGWEKAPFTTVDPTYLRSLFANIRAMIQAGDAHAARLADYLRAPLKKKTTHEQRRAAKVIAAHLTGLAGPGAFDARLYPRTGRNKKG